MLYKKFGRGHNVIRVWNHMSTLNMALASRILTVAHISEPPKRRTLQYGNLIKSAGSRQVLDRIFLLGGFRTQGG